MSTAAQRVGPILLTPGVRKLNFWAYIYASFICIAMLAGMNFLQIYLLEVNLAVPADQQGKITGLLATYTELVAILLIIPFGYLADRLGRRPVVVGGLLLCGLGSGLRAARNPRVTLSYLAAFAGRSDNAIKGLFLSARAAP